MARVRPVQFQFIGLHWATGTAVWMDQGAYKDETFWEQMEAGVPWTRTKKFLLIVPIILCVALGAGLPCDASKAVRCLG